MLARLIPKYSKTGLHALSVTVLLAGGSSQLEAQNATWPGSVTVPEAHYWHEAPGVQLPKPQPTVKDLFNNDASRVTLDQIRLLDRPVAHNFNFYEPKTDQQLAVEEAERETTASRIGGSKWHYGVGVGFEDIRLRLSYDF